MERLIGSCMLSAELVNYQEVFLGRADRKEAVIPGSLPTYSLNVKMWRALFSGKKCYTSQWVLSFLCLIFLVSLEKPTHSPHSLFFLGWRWQLVNAWLPVTWETVVGVSGRRHKLLYNNFQLIPWFSILPISILYPPFYLLLYYWFNLFGLFLYILEELLSVLND